MAGEWNEENWFDLADYADVDMDAEFDYEPRDDSSYDIAASGDLPTDPGDNVAGGVEKGSLSPTTVRPREESTLSKDKGQSDQDHTQVDSRHDENFSSKCPSPPKAVRLGLTVSVTMVVSTSSTSEDHILRVVSHAWHICRPTETNPSCHHHLQRHATDFRASQCAPEPLSKR